MSDQYLFDYHISQIQGEVNEQRRSIGGSLFQQAQESASEWQSKVADLTPSYKDLAGLSDGSWLLKFDFKLEKPFASKSEVEFHHYEGQHEVQSPIVRDHLTGIPMVRPTTWKGHLRFATRMVCGVVDKVREPDTMRRLFGETREEKEGSQGRLRFFPTFLSGNLRREVITPLKRDTRTPDRGPIDIEVMPAGAEGTFCLLYVPSCNARDRSLSLMAANLQTVAGALRAMFLEYGFSAKKTAGWGVVKDELRDEGKMWGKGNMWPLVQETDVSASLQEPDAEWCEKLIDTSGNPLSKLLSDGGTFLSNNEFQALSEKPVSLSSYKRFRNWHKSYGEQWVRKQTGDAEPETELHEYSFSSITDLEELLGKLAKGLNQENDDG